VSSNRRSPNRAGRYLLSVLTPDQMAEYDRQAALDARDSRARTNYRRMVQAKDGAYKARKLASLVEAGYCNAAGEWIAADVKKPG
jgi:hypothetical protein